MGNVADLGQIFLLVESGELEKAKQILLKELIMEYARDTCFSWINHPEYLYILDFRRDGNTVTAAVSYRGDREETITFELDEYMRDDPY